MNKVVVFQTGNEEYAIPLQHVVSIEKIEEMTPIPQMPEYVKGMIEIREELFPVIDLEYIFYHRFTKITESARLVVIQSEELSLGVLVNDAKEIIDIPTDKIKQVALLAHTKTAYISGIVSLDGRIITIIDPKVLIISLEGIDHLQDFMQSHQ